VFQRKHSKVRIGEHLPDEFSFHYRLKLEDVLTTLLFDFALENVTSNDQENKDGLELKGEHQLAV
jgi:hypothetical protein